MALRRRVRRLEALHALQQDRLRALREKWDEEDRKRREEGGIWYDPITGQFRIPSFEEWKANRDARIANDNGVT